MDQDLENAVFLIIKFFVGIAIGYVIGMFLFTPVQADTITAETIVKEVHRQSAVYAMDPDLALAVIEVESNFDPNKTGLKGEIGLFQLLPVYFPTAKHDLTTNIKLGILYLRFVKQNCPVKEGLTYVICYNQGLTKKPKHPLKHPYYMKVMSAYEKIKVQNRYNNARRVN